jgi:hypothetical protein
MTAAWRTTGIVVLAACSFAILGCRSQKCETGKYELPTAWTDANFQVVEGGYICTQERSPSVTVRYLDAQSGDLFNRFMEKFKGTGWTVNTALSTNYSFVAERGNKALSVALRDCPTELSNRSTWSKCTDVAIDEVPFHR